jgi:hypothetical protein
MRAHRRANRRVGNSVDELTRAVTDARAARDIARLVMADLATVAHPSAQDVLTAVAARCTDDVRRSALAAYLHVCRDVSLEMLGQVFGIDSGAARRLVERGSGTAPVTAADECRGWALVAPRVGRTDPELRAASGHLSLCRRCRYRLRAHAVLEHRVAAAGSVAFGASVTAAIGRAIAGGNVGSAAAGAITGPIVALSTAAALTAGAGALAVTTHGHGAAHYPAVSHAHPHNGGRVTVDATPAASSGPASGRGTSRRVGPAVAPTAPAAPAAPAPAGVTPSAPAPLPGSDLLKLPAVSPPALPLPLPTVSVPPLIAPTSPPPLPLPSLSLPPLP